MQNLILLAISLFSTLLPAQYAPQIYGPMWGYNTDSETVMWVQGDTTFRVSVEYFRLDKPSEKRTTTELTSQKGTAFSVKIPIQGLDAGTKYQARLIVNGELRPQLYNFQTQPAEKAFEFSVATGSCACLRDKSSPSKRSGYDHASGYHIYRAIAKRKPDYMAWLGDNIYLRNGEWNSFEGVCYRYTHTRKLPQIQELLRHTHHFSTWDDHDYGSNNGNERTKSKDFASEGFELFWANPKTHPEGKKGIYYQYSIGDADFFMTDDRYFRSPDTLADSKDKHFLGAEQLEWLLDGLENSKAAFKLVAIGTQYLNPNPHPRKEGYWIDYPSEAQYFLHEIKRRNIEGVFFLTGDVHHSVMSKLPSPDFYPLYDLTVSAFTSIQNPFFGVKNPLKVRGTFAWEHNYAMLRFKGKDADRRMEISLYNKFNLRKWKRTIWAKDLRIAK